MIIFTDCLQINYSHELILAIIINLYGYLLLILEKYSPKQKLELFWEDENQFCAVCCVVLGVLCVVLVGGW